MELARIELASRSLDILLQENHAYTHPGKRHSSSTGVILELRTLPLDHSPDCVDD